MWQIYSVYDVYGVGWGAIFYFAFQKLTLHLTIKVSFSHYRWKKFIFLKILFFPILYYKPYLFSSEIPGQVFKNNPLGELFYSDNLKVNVLLFSLSLRKGKTTIEFSNIKYSLLQKLPK